MSDTDDDLEDDDLSGEDFGPDDDVGADEPEQIKVDLTLETQPGEILFGIAFGQIECADERICIQARKYAAFQMRLQGYSYRTIAEQMNRAVSTVFGWVSEEIKATVRESADELREIQLSRYDAMLQPFLEKANEGDTFAVGPALQIMGKIESLMGIEPAKKISHQFGEEQTDAARIALAKAIAAVAKSAELEGDPGDT